MCPRHVKISPDMSNVRAWLSGGHVHFLQLATRLTEVTRRHALSRHRSRSCLSCWRAARCSWSRSLIPRVRACCWAIIRGFLRRDTIAGAVRTRRNAVFPIGLYAQCWSCFSELDVGWSEPFLFICNRKTGADITLSDIRLGVETL